MEAIRIEVLDGVLKRYASRLEEVRAQEVYKWQAVMHPETHYIYKTTMYREAATFLGIGYPGNKFDKVIATV